MKSTPKIALVALIAAALLASGGCSADPSQAIPKSEPAFKPVFKTDAEALAAAEKDYAGYVPATVEMGATHTFDEASLSRWATPKELTSLRGDLRRLVKEGDYDEGQIVVTHFALQELHQPASKSVTLTAYVCDDVSSTKLLNQAGGDVTPATRPTLVPLQVRFKNQERGSAVLKVDGSFLWKGRDFC